MASVSTFHAAAGTDDASWEDIMLPRGAREPPHVPRGPPLRYYLTTVVEAMAAAHEHPPVDAEVAPAGYAKDLLHMVDGEELQAMRKGASCLLLSGDQMLEQMGVIGQIEEDLAKSVLDGDEDGELSPTARRTFNTTRLAEAKQNTGCHGSGKVTVQSGWVMEDCLHHMETFSLLTAGPLFEEARVKAIMTEKELASPAVVRSVSQLAVLGHMYKRMQGAAWFVTRWGLQNVVTEEDGPGRKAQVDALTREGRTRYSRGANARRPGQRGANARRPGQRGANARRPGQRGANAWRPGQRGANASGMGGAAVATE
eukprot:jgi/Tetstr1/466304/TSEL_010837.t1